MVGGERANDNEGRSAYGQVGVGGAGARDRRGVGRRKAGLCASLCWPELSAGVPLDLGCGEERVLLGQAS